jgi:hypothetical protein
VNFHPGYEYSGVVRALCSLEQVGGDVQLIVDSYVDASFVEEGIVRYVGRGEKERMGGRRANERCK